MKKLLLISCVITLLTATGCLVPGGRGYGHGHGPRYHGRSEVIVREPVIVAPRPVVVVPVPVIVAPRVRVRVD